uniref:Uncharacterized protein n=1 Tax=Rhizophora mucronata TaxID=61149 RepID=A0A2P2KJJ0_RHIMU
MALYFTRSLLFWWLLDGRVERSIIQNTLKEPVGTLVASFSQAWSWICNSYSLHLNFLGILGLNLKCFSLQLNEVHSIQCIGNSSRHICFSLALSDPSLIVIVKKFLETRTVVCQ